jgi:aldehyde dehydrogenase (NAD+)
MTLNLIDGEWSASDSGRHFTSLNPATGAVVDRVTDSTSDDVDRAMDAARAALHSWRETPAPARADLLYRVADLLKARKPALARLVSEEMGKPLVEAGGEVQEAIDMALYMAGEGRRSFGQTVPSELPDKFAMSVREPVGVVAMVTPWNFPIAVPSWKLLPALVLGNTVVWKPSPETPVCAARLADVFVEAGLPRGVLNLVAGAGNELSGTVVRHPRVRLVSFTGSTQAGRHVAVACAELGKRCALELGGKNAVIVLDDADLDLAVDGILWSAFGTSGQRCTACSRVIAHRQVREELTDRLVERAQRLTLGNPVDPGTEMGPLIHEAAMRRVDDHVRAAVADGARLRCGGGRITEGELGRGWFYRPTILDAVTPHMPVAREEIFGPVLSILEAGSLDEAVAISNDTAYGLSASIYTRNVNRAFRAMRRLDAGLVYVNAGTTGSEVQLPFGGTRATGNGAREAGTAALDTYSEWKTLYVDYSGRLQRAQIDTDTRRG